MIYKTAGVWIENFLKENQRYIDIGIQLSIDDKTKISILYDKIGIPMYKFNLNEIVYNSLTLDEKQVQQIIKKLSKMYVSHMCRFTKDMDIYELRLRDEYSMFDYTIRGKIIDL